jgi:hypothetical protein
MRGACLAACSIRLERTMRRRAIRDERAGHLRLVRRRRRGCLHTLRFLIVRARWLGQAAIAATPPSRSAMEVGCYRQIGPDVSAVWASRRC